MSQTTMKSRSHFSEWLQEAISVYTGLGDEEKNAVLDAFIQASGPSQLYALSKKVPLLVFRDFISFLPPEIVINILQHLDGEQLLLSCQVCKSWNKTISSHTDLWWCLAKEAGADVCSFREDDYNHLRNLFIPENKWSESQVNKGWILKQLYIHTVATLKGFSSGKSIHINENFVDRGSRRITCVSYQSGNIVTGCDDHTVQIWSVPEGSLCNSISTHSVSSLTMTSRLLYTASFNSYAESWDLVTRQASQNFCGHTSAVLAIDVSSDESFLLTGSVDKTAKLWDLRTTPAQLTKTFSDIHTDWVFQVRFLPAEISHICFVTCDTSLCNLWLMTCTGELVKSYHVNSDSPSKFTSFYHAEYDPNQMFTCQWDERNKSSWFSKYCLHSIDCSIQRDVHVEIPLEGVKAYLLGAGRKFAVIMCSISRKDFYVFDIPKRSVIATIVTPDFYMLTRNGSTVTLCETQWLDGFRFTEMEKDTPVFAASVERSRVILGTWSEPVTRPAEWSSSKTSKMAEEDTETKMALHI